MKKRLIIGGFITAIIITLIVVLSPTEEERAIKAAQEATNDVIENLGSGF